uniref:Uncharacterized protein n=1 Tax=viral metagenome TaxID=1070528 RepID=A0A6C0BPH3_9ZZZZ
MAKLVLLPLTNACVHGLDGVPMEVTEANKHRDGGARNA